MDEEQTKNSKCTNLCEGKIGRRLKSCCCPPFNPCCFDNLRVAATIVGVGALVVAILDLDRYVKFALNNFTTRNRSEFNCSYSYPKFYDELDKIYPPITTGLQSMMALILIISAFKRVIWGCILWEVFAIIDTVMRNVLTFMRWALAPCYFIHRPFWMIRMLFLDLFLIYSVITVHSYVAYLCNIASRIRTVAHKSEGEEGNMDEDDGDYELEGYEDSDEDILLIGTPGRNVVENTPSEKVNKTKFSNVDDNMSF